MIETIETLLGQFNESQVDILIEMMSNRVINELKGMGASVDSLPPELEHIVVELVIARYNRIGSEGMAKESEEGRTIEYADSLMQEHMPELSAWAKANNATAVEGMVRFI